MQLDCYFNDANRTLVFMPRKKLVQILLVMTSMDNNTTMKINDTEILS